MAGNPERLVLERLSGANGRAAGQHRAAAGVGAGSLWGDGRVAADDPYRVQTDAQRVGDDLRQRGLVSLALRGDAERRGHAARRVHADEGGLGAGRNRHARGDGNGGADAGQLDVRGVAEPHPAASGACLGNPVARRVHVQHRPRLVHALGQTGLIPDQAGRRLVWKVVGPDVVSEPEFGRVHVQPARRPIHQTFQYEGGDRAAYAAVGTNRRLARRHAAVARPVVRHAVRPGQKADRLDRLDRGRPRIDRVGADVRGDVGPQAGNRPVAVEREFGIDDLVPRLGRGQQVFAPVADPLDGPFEQPGEGAQHDLFGIERGLRAEAAAHVRGHDPNAVLRQVEQIGQRVAQQARTLRGRTQRQLSYAGIVLGQAAAALHAHRGVAPKPEPPVHAQRGPGEGGVDVTAREFARQQHVGASLVMQRDGLGSGGLDRIVRHGQRLVLDLDPFRGVFGHVAAFRHHHGDRFADVADLLDRQGREGRLPIFVHSGRGAHRFDEFRNPRAGQHRGHAVHQTRCGGVDLGNARVCVRAAEKRRMEQAGRRVVVDVRAPAGEQAFVFAPLDARADQLRRECFHDDSVTHLSRKEFHPSSVAKNGSTRSWPTKRRA